MINGNENDTENEKNRSRRCNINRSRPRYGRKFSTFSIIQYNIYSIVVQYSSSIAQYDIISHYNDGYMY